MISVKKIMCSSPTELHGFIWRGIIFYRNYWASFTHIEAGNTFLIPFPYSHLTKFLIYLLGCAGSSLLCVGFLLLQWMGTMLHCSAPASLNWTYWTELLLPSTGSRLMGFSSCSMWAQELWYTGLVILWHVWSSQTRDQTHIPCIHRWILNHWTHQGNPPHEVSFSPNFCFKHFQPVKVLKRKEQIPWQSS